MAEFQHECGWLLSAKFMSKFPFFLAIWRGTALLRFERGSTPVWMSAKNGCESSVSPLARCCHHHLTGSINVRKPAASVLERKYLCKNIISQSVIEECASGWMAKVSSVVQRCSVVWDVVSPHRFCPVRNKNQTIASVECHHLCATGRPSWTARHGSMSRLGWRDKASRTRANYQSELLTVWIGMEILHPLS